MRKLLAILAILAAPAQAQQPNGTINAPIYATGYISQVGGTNVTTTIKSQPNHPTNLNIYTTGAISGTWSIQLPNPAFEGQMLSFNCGAAANAIAITSSDGSSIDSNLPTSCTTNGGFVTQFDLRSNIWRSLGSGYSANFRPFTGVASQWPWQLNADGTWTLKQPDASDVTFTQSGTGASTRSVDAKLKDGALSPEDFGATGNGVADDTAAITSALAAAGVGGVVQLKPGKIYYVTGLTIPSGVTLRGTTPRPEQISGTAAAYNTLPGISLNTSGTITLSRGAVVSDLFVKNSALTYPVTSPSGFAGTAFTMTDDAPVLRNILAIGFNLLVGQTGTSVSRFVLEGFYGDGNAGIYLTLPSYDSSIVRDVHLWPFAVQNHTTCAALQRPYNGIHLAAAQDDTLFDNILTYGFSVGVHLINTGGASFDDLWTDYPVSCASGSGSKGLFVEGGVTNINFGQFWAWSMENGIVANMDAATTLKFGIVKIQSVSSAGVTVTGGDLYFSNLDINTTGTWGFDITNAASYVYARGKAASTASGLVSAPVSGVTNNLDIKMQSDTAAGLGLFVSNTIAPKSVASAATINLPVVGDDFTITGTNNFNTLAGGWGGRRVTLRFTGVLTVFSTVNIVLATNTYTTAANSFLELIYDSAISKWVEIARGPLSAMPSSGTLAVANGGTGSNLSATGGTSQVLKQTTSGGNVTVGQLACSDLSGVAASCSTDTTNASNISSGTLPAARLTGQLSHAYSGSTTANIAAATTTYLGPNGAQSTEGFALWTPANSTTFATIQIGTGAPGAGQSYTYTLRKNSADTALTCTISGAASYSCSASGAVSYSPGDEFNIKVVTSAAAAAAPHRYNVTLGY